MDSAAPRRLQLGYWLSSEEHGPNRLIELASRAEEAGFGSAMISDHFHPWLCGGQAPFVWGVLGGIAGATRQLRVGTGVTAPILRMHPAIVAQAAATAAVMLEGRFFLGLGTGERLNEHVTGRHWPPAGERREMVEEAVQILRRLLAGEEVAHRGAHFTVEDARLHTRPAEPPPLYLSGSSKAAAALAGRIGDGFIGIRPLPTHIEAFEGSGGSGKPRLAKLSVCWADSVKDAVETAHRCWPNVALAGSQLTELARPADFEQATRLVRSEDVAAAVVCGPDPEAHLAGVAEFASAGFDQVYIHQIGPDQEGFFDFYRREITPRLPLAT